MSSFNIFQNFELMCITWGSDPVHRVAAGDPECSRTCLADSVPDIWENMKQDFKPFLYSHEHREAIGSTAPLAGLGSILWCTAEEMHVVLCDSCTRAGDRVALQDGIWLLSTFSFSRITIILEELESLAWKQMQHLRCTGEAWSQLTSTESVGLT